MSGRARSLTSDSPAGEKIDETLQDVLHLAIDLAIRIVEHYRDAIVGEHITARLGEVETPARRLDRVGSRQ